MDKLIEYGMWPLAAVIIGVVTILAFRIPLTALILRTKKIGAGDRAIDFADAAATERQQEQFKNAAEAPKQLGSPLVPPSESIAALEKDVLGKIAAFNDDIATKEKLLVRAVANLLLQNEFEATYRIIFGSQLDLLLRSNMPGGTDKATADAIYQNAQANFPSVHTNPSSDSWLQYPITTGLIEFRDGRYWATTKGREFMQYLVAMGLTGPKAG